MNDSKDEIGFVPQCIVEGIKDTSNGNFVSREKMLNIDNDD